MEKTYLSIFNKNYLAILSLKLREDNKHLKIRGKGGHGDFSTVKSY